MIVRLLSTFRLLSGVVGAFSFLGNLAPIYQSSLSFLLFLEACFFLAGHIYLTLSLSRFSVLELWFSVQLVLPLFHLFLYQFSKRSAFRPVKMSVILFVWLKVKHLMSLCVSSKSCCAGCSTSGVCWAFLFWLPYYFALLLPIIRDSENSPRKALVLVCLKLKFNDYLSQSILCKTRPELGMGNFKHHCHGNLVSCSDGSVLGNADNVKRKVAEWMSVLWL